MVLTMSSDKAVLMTVHHTLQELWYYQLGRFQEWVDIAGFPMSPMQAQAALLTIIFLTIIAASAMTRYLFSRGGSFKRMGETVLILGLCGSGKTALFLILRNGYASPTVSSLKANRERFPFIPDAKTFTDIIDYPGHQRLQQSVPKLFPQTRCIVYVINAAGDENELKDVAEHLFNIFTTKGDLPLILACNKSDIPDAKTPDVIMAVLEKEIELFRVSRGAVVEGQDDSQNCMVSGGDRFTFDQITNMECCTCSARNGDVDGIIEFIKGQYA